MKKLLPILLCAALLVGCSGKTSESSSVTASSDVSSEAVVSEDSSSEAVSAESAADDSAADAKTDTLDAIVSSLEAVNPIANPRALDDFSVENDMMLTMDNIVAFKGDVTNDQADCGLVFAAQVKDVDAAVSELTAYKDSLSANDLYAEFADKVALAKDARIVTKDDIVIMVIAGISGPDYTAIDDALAAL